MSDWELKDLQSLLVGKRVLGVATGALGDGSSDGVLVLDDGTELELYESGSDCCASTSGDWVLDPDNLDAAITNVSFEYSGGDDGDGSTYYATISVMHNQNRIALAECSANDGNGGYYYSTLSMRIREPGRHYEIDMEVVDA